MSKLIGVLGGTSWPSTMLAYRKLNEHAGRILGGHHSARILLYSIDYHSIKSHYEGGWAQIPDMLRSEAERLLACQPDCWMIANNTLHKAFDMIAPQPGSAVPFFHAVDLVRSHLLGQGLSRVLLLGTRFTMEDGFFAALLEQAGIRIAIPETSEREAIQAIQSRLAQGESDATFADFFVQLMERYRRRGCEAVVTACTELPLVITQDICAVPVIDPLDLQTLACAKFAMS